MINLLPPDTKSTYRYARRNRTLLRWLITSSLSLLVGVIIAAGGYLYLNQSIKATTKQIASTNDQLKSQNLPGIQKEVTSISNNLNLVVQVLSKEVLFSKLLKQLASVTPSNAILTNLAIVKAQGGVDITAQTTNYDAATQLQINLSDPKNQIFSKADIISIGCSNSTTNATNKKYPCTVNIRALFATDNPFLFINDQKVTTP